MRNTSVAPTLCHPAGYRPGMDGSLSSEDVERVTVKFKVLSLKMRSDANFGDRVALGLLKDAGARMGLPPRGRYPMGLPALYR